jgi:hypothetical protein
MLSLLAQVDIGEAFKLKPDDAGIANTKGYGSLGEFISTMLPNVFVIAGVILLVLLIAGGFVMITSAGDPEKQKNGSKALTAAIVGFIIIFASFWIIKLIEFLTGISIFKTKI